MTEATKKTEKESPKKEEMLAAILIRSEMKSNPEKKACLRMLKLGTKNSCSLIRKTPSTVGMLKKVSNLVTWGEIDSETLKILEEKKVNNEEGKIKTFRLSPPKGGFEKKGIKVPFHLGGAVGYRKDSIGKLVRRMLK